MQLQAQERLLVEAVQHLQQSHPSGCGTTTLPESRAHARDKLADLSLKRGHSINTSQSLEENKTGLLSSLSQPELCEWHDVCPTAKNLMTDLPTLDTYLRAGMLADDNEANDAINAGRDDTRCVVERVGFKSSRQHQHQQPQHYIQQQRQQAWESDQLSLIIMQLQGMQQLSPFDFRATTLPESHAHTKDKQADQSSRRSPSIETLQSLEENTEIEENKDNRGQLLPLTLGGSDMLAVTVKNTFIHVEKIDGCPSRSKSVPAAMKFRTGPSKTNQ